MNNSALSRRSFLLVLAAGVATVSAACGGAASPSPAASTAASSAAASVAASPASTSASASTSPSSASASPAASASASASSPASATAGSVKPSGKFVLGQDGIPGKSIDPGQANSLQNLHYDWPLYDGLTWIDGSGAVKPGLASSWKNVNETTWEFTLGDWSFQNGRAVTATDVVDTYDRMRDPANKLQGVSVFTAVDKIDAPDAKTVRVTTKAPDPTLPNILSLAMVLPMQEVKKQGAEAFFQKPFGTGPFKIQSIDFSTALKYTAMGADFKSPKGVPHIQDLEIRFIPETASRVAALVSGDIDAALPVTPDTVAQIKQSKNLVVDQFQNPATVHMTFPMDGPTTDLRVRQAVNYAVDKEGIIKSLLGGFGKADGQLIGPSCLGYNPAIQPYAYDLAKAKQLLQQAGASNLTMPMTLTTIFPAGNEMGQAISAQLTQAGIKTEIKVVELALWINDFYAPPASRPGLFAEILNWDQTFEPDSTWRWFSSDLPLQGGRKWNDPTFDKMYQGAKATFNHDQRQQMYQKAGQYLHDQAFALFLWQLDTLGAYKSEWTGFHVYPVANEFITLQHK